MVHSKSFIFLHSLKELISEFQAPRYDGCSTVLLHESPTDLKCSGSPGGTRIEVYTTYPRVRRCNSCAVETQWHIHEDHRTESRQSGHDWTPQHTCGFQPVGPTEISTDTLLRKPSGPAAQQRRRVLRSTTRHRTP